MFRAPKRTLGDLDAESAAKLIAASSDIALIVDGKGIIRDVAFGSEDLAGEGFAKWVGEPWIETVTIESRPKIEELLGSAASTKAPIEWRQVNHPSKRGDIPIRYSVVHIGPHGRLVAVGRDLRTVAALQQRLVDAQQSMEREYSRLRHAETRYRVLFQIASEPVLIVEANNLRLVDANPAATQLLNRNSKRIAGKAFLEIFDAESAKAIQAQLASVKATGRADEVTARLIENKRECVVSASLFRQETSSHILVRLSPVVAGDVTPKSTSKVYSVVENLPDGFVVTDLDRRILTANPAFLDLVQLANEEQVRGELIDRWVGRPGVDINALVTNIRDHGSVRHFATILRGEYGSYENVEISAVSVPTGDTPCYGFTIRNVGRNEIPKARSKSELPRSVEQLTELVGRVPLKELVRETADVIEKLCIEAALKLTEDNRASAAEMLGLSRQSLYSKLRRYGISDVDDDAS
ncbi:transcriptional regulator PpsR [Hyphomicrobium sp. ghe19]|uniref:transcriptional regulator PpsR n=1 Tax=Hyphomicrobium sp. ghe19 TaxID=2682968 RepID=UPI0030CAA326